MSTSPTVPKVRRASVLAVLGSLANAVFLFWTFRLTVEYAGVATIGCWALLQGLFLFARIADSGAGANITRFLASNLKAGTLPAKPLTVTWTGLLISSGPVAGLGLVTLPLILSYVHRRYGSDVGATEITELAVLALCFGIAASAANIILSAVEGLFLLSSRSVVTIASNLGASLVAYPLITHFGALGIGMSYCVVAAIQLIAGIYLIFAHSRVDIAVDNRNVRAIARILWRENLQLTGVAVVQLAFEPAIKFGLSLIGSLDQIASFELALRIVTQVRVLFQAAMQPLLAVGARHPSDAQATAEKNRFSATQELLTRYTPLPFAFLVAVAPLIGAAGLGEITRHFLVFTSIITAGNIVNVMGMGGYYFLLSGGQLSRLFRLQLGMAAVVLLCEVPSVLLHLEYLVVLSYAVAFALGGAYLIMQLSRRPHQIVSVAIPMIVLGLLSVAQLWGPWTGRGVGQSFIWLLMSIGGIAIVCSVAATPWYRQRDARGRHAAI